MNYLFLTGETYTNGLASEYLDIIGIGSVVFGILIIISKNPIISVLFLISLFSTISVYLIMIGVYFVGISYLLVYVGAVSILFIFILMLINIRISELLSATGNSIPLGIIVIISFYYPTYKTNSYNDNSDILTWISNNNINISYVTSNNWDNLLAETTDISTIGNIMYSNYAIWLILASMTLLLAMIGAIVITIK